MAQQLVNGSYRDGSVTITNRMSDRYAVVGEPYNGLHRKLQSEAAKKKRKKWWALRWKCYRYGVPFPPATK